MKVTVIVIDTKLHSLKHTLHSDHEIHLWLSFIRVLFLMCCRCFPDEHRLYWMTARLVLMEDGQERKAPAGKSSEMKHCGKAVAG